MDQSWVSKFILLYINHRQARYRSCSGIWQIWREGRFAESTNTIGLKFHKECISMYADTMCYPERENKLELIGMQFYIHKNESK